ncbi:MAG: 5'-nucleotidase C-terminal domain-containing protein [Hydrogenovibrio sp.]|uniref:5'-nucleotidase C-terminal domain-containing protein n=1 Tax=Hydrogenovibrio sp. TaxID=2065821 RepID=UPI002870453C|nr:5'-nucleotidase C-terminal domain-containing protein [Hydrogenovibrio sp.]MDR9498670.1 5'-nucleotidase C-terminal domain-containing protein [Hydrogenovibrio sp.]
MSLNRREFLHVMSMAAAAGMLPGAAKAMSGKPGSELSDEMYKLPMKGNVRLLHMTDSHAQLKPVYFREPNVNLGIGPAFGKLPHVVGENLLEKLDIKPGTPEAHAFTYLNFQEAAEQYGKVGGFAHMKTAVDRLRESAGGKQNTVLMDGGDLWHGSATALWTRGQCMVDASNILGVDAMVGHWEFTYKEDEVLTNVARFNGEFLGQNVRIKDMSLFSDDYYNLVDKHNGLGMYNEDELRPFKPYTVKEINGERVAIVGQAFPRTANANPQENFPDWSFGLRVKELQKTVEGIQANENVAAIVMLSHNGMDVDIKMAGQVAGIDAIFGGHTHDGIPATIDVKRPDGGVCYVTNAGSNAKFIGVMDLDIQNGKLQGVNYNLLPIFSNALPADPEMQKYIDDLYNSVYDNTVVESRNPEFAVNKDRLGKTYQEILEEDLGKADEVLYRRGNFMGTWDQIIVNALREEYDTDIALSAGVRWGTSILEGETITMERVMDETSMTYGETYANEMTGAQIKDMMEGICENIFQKDPYLQSGGDMVRIGGLDYTCAPNAEFGNRISDIRLDDGTPVEPETSYTVSGWAQVDTTGPGRPIWDVVADYLRRHKGEKKITKVNHPKLVGVKDNPGLADYDGELA